MKKSHHVEFEDTEALLLSADRLWKRGRNRDAFKMFALVAKTGASEAFHNLGYCYDVGLGVKRDFQRALYWYRRAWRATGSTGTCANIAQLYADNGNARCASFWWMRAIRLGDGDAAYEYALYIQKRRPNDRALIIKLLRRAAKSKHVTEHAREASRDLLRALEL